MASNLGAAKSIVPCEATEASMLLINTYFNSKHIHFKFNGVDSGEYVYAQPFAH